MVLLWQKSAVFNLLLRWVRVGEDQTTEAGQARCAGLVCCCWRRWRSCYHVLFALPFSNSFSYCSSFVYPLVALLVVETSHRWPDEDKLGSRLQTCDLGLGGFHHWRCENASVHVSRGNFWWLALVIAIIILIAGSSWQQRQMYVQTLSSTRPALGCADRWRQSSGGHEHEGEVRSGQKTVTFACSYTPTIEFLTSKVAFDPLPFLKTLKTTSNVYGISKRSAVRTVLDAGKH